MYCMRQHLFYDLVAFDSTLFQNCQPAYACVIKSLSFSQPQIRFLAAYGVLLEHALWAMQCAALVEASVLFRLCSSMPSAWWMDNVKHTYHLAVTETYLLADVDSCTQESGSQHPKSQDQKNAR